MSGFRELPFQPLAHKDADEATRAEISRRAEVAKERIREFWRKPLSKHGSGFIPRLPF